MFPLPRCSRAWRVGVLLLAAPLTLALLAGCGAKIRELETQVQMRDARILQLRQDMAAVRERAETAENELQRTRTRMAALEAEVEDTGEKLSAARLALHTSRNSTAAEMNGIMQASLHQEQQLKEEVERLATRLQTLEVELLHEEERREALEGELAAAKEELESSRERADSLLSTTREQEQTIRSERERRERLAGQLDEADESLKAARSELRQARDEIADLESQRSAAREAAEELRESLAAKQSEIAELEAIQKDSPAGDPEAAEAAEAAFREGLAGRISSRAVSVEREDAQVRVRLYSDDLFQTATTLLSDAGLRSLQTLDDALGEHLPRSITVEGHTDNVPVRNMPYPDNWELGAARASEVVRWLAGQPGRDASLFATTSHSFHRPLGDNREASGRRLNRRVEIVLDY